MFAFHEVFGDNNSKKLTIRQAKSSFRDDCTTFTSYTLHRISGFFREILFLRDSSSTSSCVIMQNCGYIY